MNFQAFGEAEYFAGRTEGLWNHAVVNCASPVSRQYAAFEYGVGAHSKAINRFLYFGIQCKFLRCCSFYYGYSASVMPAVLIH